MELTPILQKTLEIGGSDVFLIPGSPATAKVKGHMVALTEERVQPADTRKMIAEAYSMSLDHTEETLQREGDDDFSFSLQNLARFRCNAYKQRGTLAATCRVVTFGLPNPDALHIPPMVIDLASSCRNGMVLVTGPAGSGKSTTLACMVDRINADQDVHIITIEDPIEYLHRHDKSIVNQREIGSDSNSYGAALRAALREDPDVILVGEMRDLETISTAITAAETGHLVFSTLHTIGADKTIDRIIDVFPPDQQQQIRIQLAAVLECVVSQQLLRKERGGRVAALEVLFANNAVRNLIREGKTFQIPSIMQTSRRAGMITMDDALYDLLMKGEIGPDAVVTYAQDPVAMNKKVNFEI